MVITEVILSSIVLWAGWASFKIIKNGEKLAVLETDTKNLLTKVEFLEAQAEFKDEIFSKIDGLRNGN